RSPPRSGPGPAERAVDRDVARPDRLPRADRDPSGCPALFGARRTGRISSTVAEGEATTAMRGLAVPPGGGRGIMDRISNRFPGAARVVGAAIVAVVLLYSCRPVLPAGHVGVMDFFGRVSDRVLSPGINVVVPGTRVVLFSVQTREMKESAAVPTSEGLIVTLDVSLLYRLKPTDAARMYKNVGRRFEAIVIEPQLRSVIRDVTAEYD